MWYFVSMLSLRVDARGKPDNSNSFDTSSGVSYWDGGARTDDDLVLVGFGFFTITTGS